VQVVLSDEGLLVVVGLLDVVGLLVVLDFVHGGGVNVGVGRPGHAA
jgi:hypothetical protein